MSRDLEAACRQRRHWVERSVGSPGRHAIVIEDKP
jgi:hypothetical protein